MRVKSYLSVISQPPMPALIGVSLIFWLVLLLSGHSEHITKYYTALSTDMHTVVQLEKFWLVMLMAMMTPVLAEPIRYLWVRSLPRRRWRGVFCFMIAYLAIWMMAGLILLIIAKQLHNFAEHSRWLIVTLSLLIVIIWQISPWKQACLNHCHLNSRLSPFGLAADYDCLRFGIVKGFWCIGSCWVLMLLPLLFVNISLGLMVMVALIIALERYSRFN